MYAPLAVCSSPHHLFGEKVDDSTHGVLNADVVIDVVHSARHDCQSWKKDGRLKMMTRILRMNMCLDVCTLVPSNKT